MHKHIKKMIAPIIITGLFVFYFIGYIIFALTIEIPTSIAIFAILIPIALACTMIGVCIQRIKEIRSGEEDDLSQY